MYRQAAIAFLRFTERVLPAIALALFLGILSNAYNPYINAAILFGIFVLAVLSLAARETRMDIERTQEAPQRRASAL